MNYPKNRRSHTPEEYSKVLELYNKNKTITEISKELGINRNTINGWIHQGKLPYSVWDDSKRQAMILHMSEIKKGDKNPMWKGDDCSLGSVRERARRLYGHLVPEGHEIHHIDGNPWNNERENIDFVKRKEHMIKDGRLEQQIKRLSKGDNILVGQMRRRIRKQYNVTKGEEIYFKDGNFRNYDSENLLFLTRKEAIDEGFIMRERDSKGRYK